MDELTLPGEKPRNFIDLEKVIAGKNPRLLKVLPGFIIDYLKRIIHQDEVNRMIRENQHLFGLDFLEVVLKEMGARIHVDGIENLSKSNRWTVVANHPLGGLDGMALMGVIGKIRPDIVFPVNDILMNLENLKVLFIPINKHGSNSGNVRIIDETYSSDKAVLYFPAGLCSRKIHGKICDLEWKKSFITKTKLHKRDIVPAHIDGRNSNWFYNLAWLRAKLGIKANIEMLYLVDEMFKQKNKDIRIVFGEPIPYTTFDKRYTDLAWAQKLKDHVYQLSSNPNAKFIV
ncbi:MAG: 1-acyl-sn-glycerol-3-phosphate acyltransferase [Bacteroidetes bacterium]|nr:1-acyl-sn-glycerol-3-phosphate acyltransferase [Bacteroidota bacterium]